MTRIIFHDPAQPEGQRRIFAYGSSKLDPYDVAYSETRKGNTATVLGNNVHVTLHAPVPSVARDALWGFLDSF